MTGDHFLKWCSKKCKKVKVQGQAYFDKVLCKINQFLIVYLEHED